MVHLRPLYKEASNFCRASYQVETMQARFQQLFDEAVYRFAQIVHDTKTRREIRMPQVPMSIRG